MGQSLGTDGLMMRIAKFIVNKRKAFLALFALACVYSVISIPKVEVIEDVTEYLPKTTETRRGLDTMEEEFTTFGSGKILVANITYEQALRVAEEMEQIEGVSQVQFYDESDDAYEDEELEDYYKDASALFSITFTDEEDAEVTQRAIVKVRELVSGYSSYVYTTVDKDDAASLQKDMGVILAFASIVIVSVLLFTSLTYMEIVIFVLVFGVSALLNMGTNYLMGSISFVTNAVGTVLQLAMAIDYAIILFHRFMEEREHYEAEQAITVALSKAIPEISSSSLTTISGMVALMFMQFGIGMDLGRVMTKAIIFSLITVFLLMPALVMMFNKAIDRTRHRNFVPKINLWGKLMVKIRFVTIPLIVVGAVFGFIWSGKCQFVYDHSSINSPKKNEYLTSKDRISETFEMTNTMAVIVPKGGLSEGGPASGRAGVHGHRGIGHGPGQHRGGRRREIHSRGPAGAQGIFQHRRRGSGSGADALPPLRREPGAVRRAVQKCGRLQGLHHRHGGLYLRAEGERRPGFRAGAVGGDRRPARGCHRREKAAGGGELLPDAVSAEGPRGGRGDLCQHRRGPSGGGAVLRVGHGGGRSHQQLRFKPLL